MGPQHGLSRLETPCGPVEGRELFVISVLCEAFIVAMDQTMWVMALVMLIVYIFGVMGQGALRPNPLPHCFVSHCFVLCGIVLPIAKLLHYHLLPTQVHSARCPIQASVPHSRCPICAPHAGLFGDVPELAAAQASPACAQLGVGPICGAGLGYCLASDRSFPGPAVIASDPQCASLPAPAGDLPDLSLWGRRNMRIPLCLL